MAFLTWKKKRREGRRMKKGEMAEEKVRGYEEIRG
jgi:hypothetical protein